ncbi:MAG: LptF/LptG family permease [Hyphomicrobiaceae bacterium]
MSTLSRYIFRQAAATTVVIVLSLTSLVWIALALRQLNLVTAQGQDALAFLKITLLGLPSLMAVIAPVALLIASIQLLNRLSADSELIVMTAAGAKVWAPARPLIVLAVMVSLVVLAFNFLVMPWANRALREAIIAVRTDLITQVIQPGRFSSPERGLTFHVRDRAPSGELLGLVLNDARDGKQTTTFLAERARIVKQGGETFLLMQSGHILRRAAPGEPTQIIVFESYGVDLAHFEARAEQRGLRPRERYLSELLAPAPEDVATPRARNLIIEELHERLSSPLYPLAFVLIAVAMLGQARTTRQGRGQALVLAFVLATAARVSGLTVNNMISLNPGVVPLVYAIPLGTALLAAAHAHAGMRPRRMNTPWARMALVMGEKLDLVRERWRARRIDQRRRRAVGPHGMGATGR